MPADTVTEKVLGGELLVPAALIACQIKPSLDTELTAATLDVLVGRADPLVSKALEKLVRQQVGDVQTKRCRQRILRLCKTGRKFGEKPKPAP